MLIPRYDPINIVLQFTSCFASECLKYDASKVSEIRVCFGFDVLVSI